MRFNNNTSLNTLLKAWNALGLHKGNTNRNITKKYHKLAAQSHPNKGGNTAKFQELQHLYSAIMKAHREHRLNAVVAAAEARLQKATGLNSLFKYRRPVPAPASASARAAPAPNATLGVRATNQKRRAAPSKPKQSKQLTRPTQNYAFLFSSRATGPGMRRRGGLGGTKRPSGWYGFASFM